MCYGESGTVKYFETLADNVFRHNYSMMQIKKIIERWEYIRVTQVYTLKGTQISRIVQLSTKKKLENPLLD